MKGLVYKDLLMLKKYGMAFFVLAVVFCAVAAMNEGSFFFFLYPVLIASMLPVTILSYDERNRWISCADTLPCSRGAVVSVKYLLVLLLLAVCLILSLLAQGVRAAYVGQFQPEGFLSMAALLCSVGLLAPSLLLPVVFKLGAERGRIAYYIIIGALCAFFVTLGMITSNGTADLPAVFAILPGWGPLLILLTASALLFFLSWQLSIYFYKKREL